jgi:hypothetical protein
VPEGKRWQLIWMNEIASYKIEEFSQGKGEKI